MRATTLGIFGFVILASGMVVLQGQGKVTPPGAYWSKAKIDAALQVDRGSAGGNRVEFYAPGELGMRRRFADKANDSSIHPKVDEFMYVREGSGTFMTGGSYNDPKDRNAGVRGGETFDLKPGDLMMLPAGALHGFTKINGSVTVFEGRYPARNPVQDNQHLTKAMPPGHYWSKAKSDAWLLIEPEHIGGGNTVEFYAPGEVKLRTRFATESNNKSIHDDIDEFMLITGGSGTFMTGGAYDDDKNRDKGIHGGEAHDVTPGDFIMIPAGTLHGFMKINGTVTMLEGRYPPAAGKPAAK